MHPVSRHGPVLIILRYASAGLAVLLASGLRLWLEPLLGEWCGFFTYSVAVLAVAWYGGLGPALVTVALGSLTAGFFSEGADGFDADSLLDALVVMIAAVLLVLQRRAKERAESLSAEVLRRQEQLEREIAERRRAEERLQLAQAALLDADRRKDQFLATLAHELRNPLASLHNVVAVLRLSADLDQEQSRTRRATDLLEPLTDQMTRLVEDLLDIARIKQGKVELRCETVAFADIIERAVETTRAAIEARRHHVWVDLPSEPVWLLADSVRLVQALSNLLQNAAKFTPEGGRIEVGAWREGGTACVRVRDNGIGIPTDAQEFIFDVFMQADSPDGAHVSGLGIGLALVRQLVALHGGTVRVDSEGMGKGAAFTIRLPAFANTTPQPADVETVAAEST